MKGLRNCIGRSGKKMISVWMALVLTMTGIVWDVGNDVITAEAASSFSEFPASYRPYLQALQKKYPKWQFKPLNTGLDWNTVVENEMDSETSGNGNKSTIHKDASDLLKRNLPCDYNTKTGTYIYKDSTSFVSAAKQTVAYYLDPRNFLNEVNIFQFEDNSYNSGVHTLEGVKKILAGTFMDYAQGDFTYLNTSGVRVKAKTTYAEVIYNAGKSAGISPYWLASKIKQEVGVNGSGSTSGKYTSKDKKTTFTGYYNFYNIGANDGADPITNGLNYAKNAGWNTPMKAIEGGAKFFYEKYISCYQNTGYLVKFNVDKRSGNLYWHQFMTAISGAAQESISTYQAYNAMGTLSDKKVFLIPVYKNMPDAGNTITITAAANKKAVTDGGLNVRSGPGLGYATQNTLASGTTVTVLSGMVADDGYSYNNLCYPYWYKIQYSSNGTLKTGYVYCEYLNLNVSKTLVAGQTWQVAAKRKNNADIIYWQSSNPAVATVNNSGVVTANKAGDVVIYAFLGNGAMDAIHIKVDSMSISPTSKNVYVGNKLTLKVTTSAADKRITYSSDNKKVATVSASGVVTAVSPGKAVIKAKASSGGYKTCTVTVLPTKSVLQVKSYAHNCIKLSWTKSTKATGYRLYRREKGKGSYVRIKTISSPNTKTYIDRTVVTGKQYEYRLRAYTIVNGKYYFSAYTNATGTAKPRTVTGITVSRAKTQATIHWNRVSGATGYVIYRKAGSNGKYKKVATRKGSTNISYTDKNLNTKTTYYYMIRAYKKYNGKNYYGENSKAVK